MSLDIYLACDHCGYVQNVNLTHNLADMAREARIYEWLWRAPENDVRIASQLVEPLTVALDLLRSDPERFERLNPPNGWGTYEGFMEALESLLSRCLNIPAATVSVSR